MPIKNTRLNIKNEQFINVIDRCLVPKLAKFYEEADEYPEFQTRNNYLGDNFPIILKNLQNFTKNELQKNPTGVAILIILYYELNSNAKWNTPRLTDIAKKLNEVFIKITDISLESVFISNNSFDSEIVFYECFEMLHLKLTSDNIRLYPTQVLVYCKLLENIQNYYMALIPSKIFPITLLLIEDSSNFYKRKGLHCCSVLLKCLKTEDFKNGNYYEVIFKTLIRNLCEKDLDLLKLTLSSILQLCKILPEFIKSNKLDELYISCLDQISMESNLYRKVEYFNFISNVITIHKEKCCNKSLFKHIVYQNLDICTNTTVIEIICKPLLLCLEQWIVYCWPVWKYSLDHKMLSSLLKVLYVCKEEILVNLIQKIIVILISLCTPIEQKQLLHHLEKYQDIQCDFYSNKVEKIISVFKM
ncbi:unnamed protein product [Leptosia nina]|uniref:TELO2-interacting protein 2 n=1 Tax=Leptosia nina TaxID=320188 RepID=A0AAV1J9R6_9NEOP